MKRCGLWLKLALLFCAAVAIVSASPSSLAYIAANSNTLHNSFRVVYLPPQDISVPVTIHKSILNLSDEEISPGGYKFSLVNVDSEESVTAVSSIDGLATMQLHFTAADVGKTYRYQLREVDTGRKNVVYDRTVYDISITLNLNEAYEMSAELALNGNAVTEIHTEFENKYYVPVPMPDTGDPNQPMLWLAMLILSVAGLIIVSKKKTISGGRNG